MQAGNKVVVGDAPKSLLARILEWSACRRVTCGLKRGGAKRLSDFGKVIDRCRAIAEELYVG